MYKVKHPETYQMSIDDFIFPYGELDSQNRWIKLSSLIPWRKIELEYSKLFCEQGAGGTDVQIALGSLILQNMLQCSDRELVNQVKENPYLQFFLGLKEYSTQVPFSASSLVSFRKRMGEMETDFLSMVNEQIIPKHKALMKVVK
jgi:transposase, IS5 family